MVLKEILERVIVKEVAANLDLEILGISYDSRTIKAGELFIAIRGYQSDGHRYIKDAFESGAACVICEEAPEIDKPHIIVEDSRKALASASAAWFGYPSEKLKIIGVTGTNGKTTVTNLIKHIIENCTGKKAGLIGTNGNMIGNKEIDAELTTPESFSIHELLGMMLDESCEYAVMEVSSHSLHQNRVHGMEFELGVYTNLSPDHLDFHDSLEEYAQAKAKLFEISRKAAINIDDDYAQLMLAKAQCPVMTYAIKNDTADLVAKSVKLASDRVNFCALSIGSLNRAQLNIPGMFSVYNALSAISAGMLLGFGIEELLFALGTCKGVKGRVEVVPINREFTVLIDYAHTPDALENVITTAQGFAGGRVVTLFGCGGDRDRKKRPMMGEIAAKHSDFVIVTSDNPRTEAPGAIIDEILLGMDNTKTPYRVIENRREAIYWALENAQQDDVLILAGKGHETYQIFGKEKRHFDEREVVADYYRDRA